MTRVKTRFFMLLALLLLLLALLLSGELSVNKTQQSHKPLPTQQDPPMTTTAETTTATTTISAAARADVMADFAQAPAPIQGLALAIVHGQVPSAEALQQLDQQALKAEYATGTRVTIDGREMEIRTCLLLQAVDANNLAAAKALVAAGADVNCFHSAMAFSVVDLLSPGATSLVAFPDFSASLPWYRLYLQHGGKPNAQKYGFSEVTLLEELRDYGNLAATLLLLEYGADPWLNMDKAYGNSLMVTLASSQLALDQEVLMRWSLSGHLPRASRAQVDQILAIYKDHLHRYQAIPGPDAQRTLWVMRHTLRVLGQALGREEEVQDFLAGIAEVDRAYGAWFLTRDSLHSPPPVALGVASYGDVFWEP